MEIPITMPRAASSGKPVNTHVLVNFSLPLRNIEKDGKDTVKNDSRLIRVLPRKYHQSG